MRVWLDNDRNLRVICLQRTVRLNSGLASLSKEVQGFMNRCYEMSFVLARTLSAPCEGRERTLPFQQLAIRVDRN